MAENSYKFRITLKNKLGLHARPALFLLKQLKSLNQKFH